MKETITETITKTKVTCDHCGGEAVFSPDECIVCGKHACDKCIFKSATRLEMREKPRFYAEFCSYPTFEVSVCVGCESELTKRFVKLKAMVDEANNQCKEWHSHYLKEVKALNLMREKIERARGVE